MPGMKLFTTLTNMQGFDYTVDFNSDTPQTKKYTMVVHNDYACFRLTDQPVDPNAISDGWIPLNLADGTNKDIAANAAMATGAFPIGLKSRTLNRKTTDVSANQWLKDYIATNPLTTTQCETLNIDGGTINNEPFEKVRDVLVDLTNETPDEYQDYDKFKSTLLMIEPFPTKLSDPINQSQVLSNMIALLPSTVISQMRSKPEHFSAAMKDNCAGQYLISPTRKKTDANDIEDLVGERAIACGALGGFSGFINKEFRVHDYFLGRYNCKIFLRDYFTVPESALTNNEIFADGYAGADRSRFKSQYDDSYQIIPVFSDTTDYTFPDFKFSSGNNWPTLQNQDIDNYQGALKSRIKAILQNVFALGWFGKVALSVIGFLGLNNTVTNAVLKEIKDQLAIWELLPKQTDN